MISRQSNLLLSPVHNSYERYQIFALEDAWLDEDVAI